MSFDNELNLSVLQNPESDNSHKKSVWRMGALQLWKQS